MVTIIELKRRKDAETVDPFGFQPNLFTHLLPKVFYYRFKYHDQSRFG